MNQSSRLLLAYVASLALALLLSACTLPTPLVQDTNGQPLPLLNPAIATVDAVGEPGIFTLPRDAAPSPDGQIVYFVAESEQGAGLFQVPTTGGDEVALAVGAPFVDPLSVAVASDGTLIYVADSATEADGGSGAILVVPAAGGVPAVLAGTQGSAARGVEVRASSEGDMVYFTGIDPADGEVAVMRIAAAGGELTILAKGAPLVTPMGIAITAAGIVYVADRDGAGEGQGVVYRIEDGVLEPIADAFRTGPVVGAALTLDDSLLLVSALHPRLERAQVLVVNLATGEQGIVNKGISHNQGAGGVHRAHDHNTFAWADYPVIPVRPPVTCCRVYAITLNAP